MATSTDAQYPKVEELDEDRSMTQGQRKQGQYQGKEDADHSQQQVNRPRYKEKHAGGEQGMNEGSNEEQFRRRRKPRRHRSNSHSSSSSSNTTGLPKDTSSKSARSGGYNKDDEQGLTSGNSSDASSPWSTRQQRSTRPTRKTRAARRASREEQNNQMTTAAEAEQTLEKHQQRPAEQDEEAPTQKSKNPALVEQGSSEDRWREEAQPQEEHQASSSVAPAPPNTAPAASPPSRPFGASRALAPGRRKSHSDAPPLPLTATPLHGRPSGISSARLVRQSQNTGPDTTATLQPLAEADPEMWLGTNGDPDVLLSVPNLGVDRIYLGVHDLNAHVDLHAKVLDLLELHVGADVGIKRVELEIDNVRVQAMLKVRLNEVEKIIGRVVDLLEHHPEILSNLTGGLGRGLEKALSPRTQSGWSIPPVTTTSLPVPAPNIPVVGAILDEPNQGSSTP